MWLQLGELKFEGPLGPETMEVGSSANYAEHQLISGKPLLQQLGSKLDTVTVTLRLNRAFCIPESIIGQIAEYRVNGSVISLTTGAGDIFGDFVVTDQSVTMSRLMDDGSIVECTLSVALREYATPDRASRVASASRSEAFALSSNSPIPSAPGATTMVESDASQGVQQVSTSASALDDSTTRANSIPAQEDLERKKMEIRLGVILQNARRVRNICDGFTGDLYDGTRDLDDILADIISSSLSILALLVGGTPIGAIRLQVDDLMVLVRDMQSAAAFLNSFTGTRR